MYFNFGNIKKMNWYKKSTYNWDKIYQDLKEELGREPKAEDVYERWSEEFENILNTPVKEEVKQAQTTWDEHYANIFDKEFEIQPKYLPDVKKKINFLQRKADKLGVKPLELEISQPYVKHIQDNTKIVQQEIPIEFVKVHLRGEMPQLSDWQFVASLEHTDTGNIIHSVPGEQVPDTFRNTQPYCEHCNTNRRRNSTCVVKNIKTNEYRQVGKDCLKDFTGHPNAYVYVHFISQILLEIEKLEKEEHFPVDRTPRLLEVQELLEISASVILTSGFVSSQSGENSTASRVTKYFRDIEDKPEITAEGKELADKTVQWLKDLKDEEIKSNYIHNLKTLIDYGYYKNKHFALLVSAPYAYLKNENRKVKENEEEKEPSDFVGQPKDKILLKAKLGQQKPFENQFGTSVAINFTDGEGNKYTWFTKDKLGYFDENDTYQSIDTGQDVIIFGTIKGHNEYKGLKSTLLTRCKVVNQSEIDKYSKKANIVKV